MAPSIFLSYGDMGEPVTRHPQASGTTFVFLFGFFLAIIMPFFLFIICLAACPSCMSLPLVPPYVPLHVLVRKWAADSSLLPNKKSHCKLSNAARLKRQTSHVAKNGSSFLLSPPTRPLPEPLDKTPHRKKGVVTPPPDT